MKATLLSGLLFFPAIASAHAMLDHALPAVGSKVSAAPTELKIWFDQPVGAAKSSIEVTDSTGQSVVAGAVQGDDKDNTELIVPLKPATGKVQVKWSAYCPPCDHTTHGTFSFTVGP
jgi:copper resistance protein C